MQKVTDCQIVTQRTMKGTHTHTRTIKFTVTSFECKSLTRKMNNSNNNKKYKYGKPQKEAKKDFEWLLTSLLLTILMLATWKLLHFRICASKHVGWLILISFIACYMVPTLLCDSREIFTMYFHIIFFPWRTNLVTCCSLRHGCRGEAFNCVSRSKFLIYPGSSNLPLSVQ